MSVGKIISDAAGVIRGKPHGVAGTAWRKARPKKGTPPKSKTKAKSGQSLREAQQAARERTSKRQYSKDDALARRLMATNKRRKAGTYSDYDPLSSVRGSTKVPPKPRPGPKTSKKVGKAMTKVQKRNPGLSPDQVRKKAKKIVKKRK